MTRTIKTAQSVTSAFSELDAAITAENVTLPPQVASSLAKLRQVTATAADLLLAAGSHEVRQTIKEARAKLQPQAALVSETPPRNP